jgi:hypothetical protein
MIVNALAGKPLPIYGDGMQVRDWLYPPGAGGGPDEKSIFLKNTYKSST